MSKYLNHFFILECILFVLIVLGIVPREVAFVLAGILIAYSLFASLEDVTVLFVRSIPLFIALPFTESFDNFNTWRIIALIIFARWAINSPSKNFFPLIYKGDSRGLLLILFFLAILSVLVASDQILAIKRIILILNLSMVPIVIGHLKIGDRVARNLAIPALIVTAVGFLQLALTYFVDIYQFISFWGEGIQCRQFGNEWCYIATHVGNTWFAYFGDQRSLRVFSLFTDSHTFPIFLLLAMPSFFLLKSKSKRPWLWWLAIGATYLIAILSGTRGIWAASIPIAILAIFFRKKVPAKSLILFFALFFLAWPIFNSPQFLLSSGDFRHRVKSVFDFDETSNKARIAIWKASLNSIVHHPFLGVGIGNFPVVLNENLELAKAGSSAHNFYLHIAAELGIPALLALLYFLWLVLKKLYQTNEIYFRALLLFMPWVLLYVMTDVALFDERAFLITATIIAIILSFGEHQSDISPRSKLL